MRNAVATGLAILAVVVAVILGNRARNWNDELELVSPFARVAPILTDPHTPRLTDRVLLITIDGLGIDESHLPFLDELRARGVAAVAAVPYPTISRPNYVTILSGVPPVDSGVRANRVRYPVEVDTAMDRVQAAKLRVATAADFGMMPSLFARHTRTLDGIGWIAQGTLVSPPPPVTWPIDEARRAPSLAALAPIIADLGARDFAFVPVLVLDVDRAGHASGIGPAYRTAAAEVDAMLRAALGALDLAHTTVIVTADHGHVAPGGHGGTEREVSHVALILAGAGIAPGAQVRDARLIDVAPTVAALLGIPAPGHAEGRALTEALRLAPEAAARRAVFDRLRAAELALQIAAAHGDRAPSPWRLVAAVAGLAAGLVLLRIGRTAFARPGGFVACGGIGFGAMLVAMVLVTRGELSPSYVPSLARTTELSTIGVILSIALQTIASWVAIRGRSDRLRAANTLVACGFGGALVLRGLVRAWFSAPFFSVPPPFWLVAIPAVELATATCGLACAITIVAAGMKFAGDPHHAGSRKT